MNHAASAFLLSLSGVFVVGSSVSWQYFYVNQSMSWYDAQTYCRTNYVDLVTVSSMEEQDSVIALTATAAPGYSGSVWLGLHRAWTWVTGEPYAGQVPFYASQPNEANAKAACGVMDFNGLGDWYCTTSYYFVCNNDSPTATSQLILVRIMMNWTKAEAYCRTRYAHLAIVKTSQEQQKIISMTGSAFIGVISGLWSDYSFSIFRNWTGISRRESSIVDKCVAMVISDSGRWNYFNCTIQYPFICYGAPPFQPVSRTYHAVSDLMTWPDAQSYCRKRFTDLATIDSMDDEYSVMNQVDLGDTGLLWIGLQRVMNVRWCWSRGDEPLSDYFNWGERKPSGVGQCVSNMNGLWSDTNCQTSLYFVCYSEGSGYIRVNVNKTWQDALSYCRSTYTDLAHIRSPWEQNQVNNATGRWVPVWIGLFQDSWQWSDQWSRNFRNWASGPPSLGTGDCAAVVAGNSGRWMNDSCTALHPFVCYGDMNTVNKKQIVVTKLSSSGMMHLNDMSGLSAILSKIKQKLQANGMNQGVTLSWRVREDGSVFKKVDVV